VKVSPTCVSNTISSSSSPTRVGRSRAGQEHAVEAAVGNRAGVGNATRLAPSRPSTVWRTAVPGDPRTQFGEFVRRISSRQHVEHAFERPAAQVGKRSGLADERKEVVYRQGSLAQLPTTCWASTSSGLRG
jgi:hypothetical protein